MADIRSIATAIEAYEIDHPEWNATGDLAALLVPKYLTSVPKTDSWSHPLQIAAWINAEKSPEYRVWSAGRDGKRDAKWGNPAATTNFDNDIVYENGSFIQYPEGV